MADPDPIVPARRRPPAPGWIWLDPDGRVLGATRGLLDLFGPPSLKVGDRLGEHAEVAQSRVAHELQAALGDKREGVAHGTLGGAAAPAAFGARFEFLPMTDGAGRLTGVAVSVTFVTGELPRGAEADLFYQAFLHSNNAIEITDRAGILVDVNPAFERMYGYSRSELIGQAPRIVRSPKTPATLYQGMWRDLLAPGVGEWSGELVNVDRTGREHPVLLTISAIRSGSGEITHFIGVATDLTELKLLQLQTVRTERLASLGQLAAGVAHELNTPLANIMLIADSLRRRAPNPWVTGRADSIATQVDAAARIVAGLLDFGRNHPPAVHDADLVALVKDAIEFVRGKQSADVAITEHHATVPLPVRVNRVQTIQILVNILNNAYDAMEGRGTIHVESRLNDTWAEVSITDTGPGIPSSVLPHIFEPFFTTKTDGKGTGLGLAICHGLVTAHGGRILVRSERGQGATFTVQLPHALRSVAPGPTA